MVRLDQSQRSRVEARIELLPTISIPGNYAKVLSGNGAGFYASRVGDLRILFRLHKGSKQIEIVRIEYRGGSYKGLRKLNK